MEEVLRGVDSAIGAVITRNKYLAMDVAMEYLEPTLISCSDPAPILEYLRLCPEILIEVSSRLFGGQIPQSLRTLELDYFKIPWTSPLLNNLVSLSMTSCDDGNTVGIGPLLQMLRRCPQLEELCLSRSFIGGDSPIIPAEPTHGVSLPNLKSIIIDCPEDDRVAWIINHIDFPLSASIHVGINIDTDGPPLLQSFNADGHPVKRKISTMKHLRMDSTDSASQFILCLEGASIHYSPTSFVRPDEWTLELEVSARSLQSLGVVLREFSSLSPFPMMEALEINCPASLDSAETAEWVSFLQHFPRLTALWVRGGRNDTLLEALSFLGAEATCPLLRKLRYRCSDITPTLVHIFNVRTSASCQLSRLVLDFECGSESPMPEEDLREIEAVPFLG
ncbi:hypothetical protein JAAARDRAFT_399363 [Jaapia argillacea MUCL 33604]|uniref:F-box domain-containing protein n=1 Tax=Jaapia argillacea MUCL 33604 TaxID=933084 RepID=A0A067PTI7_9AGAM|nr:hypothetical protein JAAARDRAFT_399363 [Jaapia argillacea MUCL 33604]